MVLNVMFDYLKCEYPLPLTDEIKEQFPDENWAEINFQTKSLDCYLENYTIEDDGQIYAERKDRFIDEKGQMQEKELGIEKIDWTGQLNFYFDFCTEEYDYWVEFKALVWKGDLKQIEVFDFHKKDSKARLETHEKFKEAAEKTRIKQSKWWWKSFKFWCALVRLPLFVLRWVLGLIVKFTWKLERWLTGGTFRF